MSDFDLYDTLVPPSGQQFQEPTYDWGGVSQAPAGGANSAYFDTNVEIPATYGTPAQLYPQGQPLGPYHDTRYGIANPPVPAPVVTVDSIVKTGGASPEDRALTQTWQAILAIHGYLDGDYNHGMWDAKSVGALEDAFDTARMNRVPLMEVLQTSPAQLRKETGATAGDASGTPQTSTSDSTSHSTSTSTSISRSVNLSTRSAARAILTSAMATALGREPTAQEVQEFQNGLNADERRHASVSRSNSTSESSGSSHSTSTRAPGGSHTTSTSNETSTSDSQSHSTSYSTSPDAQAKQFAEQNNKKEFSRYQGGRYMDVIAALIGM